MVTKMTSTELINLRFLHFFENEQNWPYHDMCQ